MGKGHVLAEFEPLGSFQDVSRLCESARAARQHLLVDAMCFVHDHINIMSQKALQDMALGRCDCLVASIVADARQLVTKCAAVFIFDGMPSPPGVKVAGETDTFHNCRNLMDSTYHKSRIAMPLLTSLPRTFHKSAHPFRSQTCKPRRSTVSHRWL